LKRPQLIPGILLTSSVAVMVATPATAEVVQVTGVRLNRTDGGLELILETASGASPQIFTTSSENSLIIDVLNAQLALPDGDEFRQENPTEEIAEISLIQLTPNNIQVVITGTTALPEAEVVPDSQGLVVNVSTASDTAEVVPEQGAPETLETEQEIEIVVTQTQAGERYLVPNATTGTRTETPLSDVPQSIQVIPRQVLEDQQAIRLDEALRNVSGVTFGGTDLGRGLEFNIRGFDGIPVLRNGFRQFGAGGIIPEISNLEQVEVLKGPAAILYGEVEPGGVINLVTEQPKSEPFYEIQAQLGNRDLVRPSIDLSGPLTSDRRLLYRLNALYLSGGEFQDVDTETERFFISPVLAWKISDRTDLTIELEYLNEDRPPTFGIPAFDNGILDIPFDRITNEPDDIAEEEYFNIGYDLEHRFSDSWKLRNGFRYTKQDALLEVAFPFSFDEDTGTVTRFWAAQPQDAESYSLQTNLVGEFATGSIEHTLLFGVDLNRSDDNFNSFTRLDTSTPLELNIFDPQYEAFPRPDFDDLPLFQDQETETERLGVFLQDQISFSEDLILLAGLRYDTVEQTIITNPTDSDPTSSETTQNDDAWTPRIGLVYKPIPAISLYASYSRSFTPNTGTTVDDDPLEPEEGEGFEVGVKAELLEGRLSATLAYFDITKQNVASEDPDDPFFFVATGEQQSQGIELDVVGEILPGWNLIASYAYIDAEVTEDNVIEVGNRLPNAPKHSASLWTTYEIQKGNLQGLGLGIGFNFVDDRQGDLDNSFEFDSYFLTNAAIFYQRNNWRAALNFRNLFDVDYIAGGSPVRVRGNDPGEPFTIIGSISVQF